MQTSLKMLLGPLWMKNLALLMCEFILNAYVILSSSIIVIFWLIKYSKCSCSGFLFIFSYISYLPLAHIYERTNQVMIVHFGIAVGFYQGVWILNKFPAFHFAYVLPTYSHYISQLSFFLFRSLPDSRICIMQDNLKLMDDLAALRPTIFCSVPRLYNRIYAG